MCTKGTNLCVGFILNNPFNSAITDYFVNQMAFSRHAWLKGLKKQTEDHYALPHSFTRYNFSLLVHRLFVYSSKATSCSVDGTGGGVGGSHMLGYVQSQHSEKGLRPCPYEVWRQRGEKIWLPKKPTEVRPALWHWSLLLKLQCSFVLFLTVTHSVVFWVFKSSRFKTVLE